MVLPVFTSAAPAAASPDMASPVSPLTSPDARDRPRDEITPEEAARAYASWDVGEQSRFREIVRRGRSRDTTIVTATDFGKLPAATILNFDRASMQAVKSANPPPAKRAGEASETAGLRRVSNVAMLRLKTMADSVLPSTLNDWHQRQTASAVLAELAELSSRIPILSVQ